MCALLQCTRALPRAHVHLSRAHVHFLHAHMHFTRAHMLMHFRSACAHFKRLTCTSSVRAVVHSSQEKD